jgi:hypothetical protein
MNSVDILRNTIIDKLLTISNKDYLIALNESIQNTNFIPSSTKFTSEQILMLKMSENDIENGDLINQSQLDTEDLEWLKEL